jgi:hypothetical protein
MAFNDGNLLIGLRPPVSTERMLANMEHALARGLRPVPICKPHDGLLSIAGGGPSLADGWQDLEGHVAAVNGSLGFLLERGLVPHFCGVMDPNAHMADIVAADPRVYYLVASNCDPALFDKLIGAGCDVRLWNPTPDNVGGTPDQYAPMDGGGFRLLGKEYPSQFAIGGGASIGLRLVMIGYMLGYRRFHLHGNDASFRGSRSHAYDDPRNGEWVERSSIELNGYRTSLNFIQHVTSFAGMLSVLQSPSFAPVEIEMFGDGLLQSCFRYWQAHKHEMSPAEAFQRWPQ